MKKRELDEVELVAAALEDGPITAGAFVRIVQPDTENPKSIERRMRRFVASLRARGFNVETEGDEEELTIHLVDSRAAVAFKPDAKKGQNAFACESCGCTCKATSDERAHAAIEQDRTFRYGIHRLARRYGLPWRQVQKIVALVDEDEKLAARPSRIEERRSEEVVAKVMEAVRDPSSVKVKEKGAARACSERYGLVSYIARTLGCERATARAFLKRARALLGKRAAP